MGGRAAAAAAGLDGGGGALVLCVRGVAVDEVRADPDLAMRTSTRDTRCVVVESEALTKHNKKVMIVYGSDANIMRITSFRTHLLEQH